MLENRQHQPLKSIMIAWNPRSSEVRIGPWPDRTGWSRGLRMTGGACFQDVQEMDGETHRRYLLNLFHTLVIRDGVDPQAAHKALCGIAEFATSINLECAGAT